MMVVLVAYHYPPDPAVGSLRAVKVARAFCNAGHQVHVVTARLPDEGRARLPVPAGVVIHPVTPLRSARQVVTALKSRWSLRRLRRPQRDEASQVTPWVPPTKVPVWKRLVSSLMWLPDDRVGFILPAWRACWSVGLDKIDLVYTTCPPYSPHLLGLLLRWRRRIRWVAEFRDPWAANTQKPWWVRSRAADAADAWLEGVCLRHADHVVSVSEGIHQGLCARLALDQRKRCIVIRNGIEFLAERAGGKREAGRFRIAYVGTFLYSRDPRPFLRSLAAVCRRHRLGPEEVRVDLVGLCRWFGVVSIEAEVESLGLTDVVHFREWVPPDTIRTILEQVDLLLLLAQDQPDQVPNKLYEYLGTRKPILAFADEDGETARMLRQIGGHFLVGNDDEPAAARAIETVLRRGQPLDVSPSSEALLEEWTERVQMRRLLTAIGA